MLWGINLPFGRLSPCVRQVTYALRTRAPVSGIATLPLDLHVLGLSLAFILSQDQTLLCIKIMWLLANGQWPMAIRRLYFFTRVFAQRIILSFLLFPFVHSNVFKELCKLFS